MDVELLFSRNPFVQKQSSQFTFIQPKKIETIKFPEGRTEFEFDLPKEFHSANVMVELVSGGTRKAKAFYANSLMVQAIET